MPPITRDWLLQSSRFICENLRTCRRLLRALDSTFDIDGSEFFEYNGKSSPEEAIHFLRNTPPQQSTVLISEAGFPAIADPGHKIVFEAHTLGMDVICLPGPNSIMQALASSGFNGQQFQFLGYLSNKESECRKQLVHLEGLVLKNGSSQIFMETPYRNLWLFKMIVKSLNPKTLLHISCEIGGQNARSCTGTLAEWGKENVEYLHKRPSIFILGRPKK